jgi:hypothetical protein
VVKELGNGAHTWFWEDVWVGEESLRQRFPRLFSISIQQDGLVASMRDPDVVIGWNFRWRRRLWVGVYLAEWFVTIFKSSKLDWCWGQLVLEARRGENIYSEICLWDSFGYAAAKGEPFYCPGIIF